MVFKRDVNDKGTNVSKRNWPFICCLAFTYVCSVGFGLLGRPAEMGLVALAGAIGMAFTNIDRIQRFKGAGFEAEMKKVVEEAYATTDSLKELASTLASFGIFSLAYENRWAGMNNHTTHQLKARIDKVCESLNLNDQLIDEASSLFVWFSGNDHLHKITECLSKANPDDHDARSKLDVLKRKPGEALPNVDDVKNVLATFEINNTREINESVDDYAYYLEHKKLRKKCAISPA
jgi:hypothetical protein